MSKVGRRLRSRIADIINCSPYAGADPISWLKAGGAALIVAVAAGTFTMTLEFRQRDLEESGRALENSVGILASHLESQLNSLRAPQKRLREEFGGAIESAQDFRAKMSSPEAHRLLAADVAGSGEVADLNVFDSEGRLVNSSRTYPLPEFSITDRRDFLALKSGKAADDCLVDLVQSHFPDEHVVIFSQAIRSTKGDVLGIITSEAKSATLEAFFASLSLEPGASVSMFHINGTLLARYPHLDGMVGRSITNGDFLPSRTMPAGIVTLRKNSPLDGIDRLMTVRPLKDIPIVLVATRTTEAALANWREQTRTLIIVSVLVGLIVFALHLLIIWQVKRQHERSERDLLSEKLRLRTALNHMSNGLAMCDPSLRLIACNQRFLDMFKVSFEVAKPGTSLREFLKSRKEFSSFDGDIEARFEKIAAAKRPYQFRLDGRIIQIQFEALPEGGWVCTTEDISERQRNEDTIAQLAHHDPLTGLPNRHYFRKLLEQASKRLADGSQLALLYIDLDGFKNINDSFGHSIGDELLKNVASRLKACIRSNDFVARLGGDEFAMLLCSQTSSEDLRQVVKRIYETVRVQCECQGHLILPDVSIGVAVAPSDGHDLDQILRRADLAMYSAKSAGRGTYRFFEPSMEGRINSRRQLESDLKRAVAGGRFRESGFEIHYQPVVDLSTHEVSGCEALLRWRHPVRGLISPTEFIPIAEESGLIVGLGEWVLRAACEEAANWPETTRIAVNVSPVQLSNKEFCLKVIAALAATKLSPVRLELEITEATLIRDDETARQVLSQLRGIGVRVALDDFGTGYSSLSYLHRFPFDKIKIDRSFVEGLTEEEGTESIVRAVVNIAAARNMTTTAEGVETSEQKEILRRLGCNEMQGYLFSKPRTADEIHQVWKPIREYLAEAC